MQTVLRAIAIAIAVAAACVLPAFANGQQEAGQRVEITAPRAVAAAQAVLGIVDEDQLFELSNGRKLKITSFGDQLQMRYGTRLSSVLRHDGQGNFVSRDGRLTLQFEADGRGGAQLVRLMAPQAWF